jgi:hypothetical protein
MFHIIFSEVFLIKIAQLIFEKYPFAPSIITLIINIKLNYEKFIYFLKGILSSIGNIKFLISCDSV